MESKYFYVHGHILDLVFEPVYDSIGRQRVAEMGWDASDYGYEECPNAPVKHGSRINHFPDVLTAKIGGGLVADVLIDLRKFAVSQEIAGKLDLGKYHGLVARPVLFSGKRTPENYTCISTTSYVEIDAKASHARLRWRCPYCGFADYRRRTATALVVDESSEDADMDIFHLNGGFSAPVISRRLANDLIELKPSGLIITAIEKLWTM